MEQGDQLYPKPTGQDRWVDLYGESVITCKQSGLTAKILFIKASYWSNNRHELVGNRQHRGCATEHVWEVE